MQSSPTSAAIALFAAAAALGSACGAQGEKPLPGANAPSTIRIAPENEPGKPLLVEGTVYAPDGETPAAGVVLYVYQTGLDGIYHGPGTSVPRLRGYMKTGVDGRYSYRTIRPGSYPESTIPAHVHTQLWGGGYEPQYNRDLNFADDPFVSEGAKRDSAAAARFAWICDARPDAAGLLHCTHNLKLKPHGDRFEGNIRHGLDNPKG